MTTESKNKDVIYFEAEIVTPALFGLTLSNFLKILSYLAYSGINILIVGERGTGKELAAAHFAEKSKKKLAPINCAGISDNLIVSELFGHQKGAFTGATNVRKGLIKEEHKNGIIFLDEIGDASGDFQALLLRYLETGDFKPLGSDKIVKDYKATIISATSKPENLREDLRDRFVTVAIPPLRDRKGDIPGLIKFLWDKEFEKDKNKRPQYISNDALKTLENYSWPGNVRELAKCLRLATILCRIRNGKALRTVDFPLITSCSEDSSGKKIIANLKLKGRAKSITEFLRVPENKNLDIEKMDANPVEQLLTESIFENVSPDKYKNAFWKYHAKHDHGGADIERKFGIENSTANRHLKKAKNRLAIKNNRR